jgi:hypothetical protein
MMMLPTNEIKPKVDLIIGTYLKGVKTRPEDQAVIEAATALVTSTLEAFHDLVYYIQEIEGIERRRR